MALTERVPLGQHHIACFAFFLFLRNFWGDSIPISQIRKLRLRDCGLLKLIGQVCDKLGLRLKTIWSLDLGSRKVTLGPVPLPLGPDLNDMYTQDGCSELHSAQIRPLAYPTIPTNLPFQAASLLFTTPTEDQWRGSPWILSIGYLLKVIPSTTGHCQAVS